MVLLRTGAFPGRSYGRDALSLVTQGLHRAHRSRTPCRYAGGKQTDHSYHQGHGKQGHRIEHADAE